MTAHSWDACLDTETGMCEIAASIPQAAVDAAFPILHGGFEFRDDEASLRADCERPVREALAAAGLADLLAERDRLQKALETQAAMVIPAQVNAIRGVAEAMQEVGAIGALGYRMMQMTADRIEAMTQASVEATQFAQEALNGGGTDG